MKKILVCLRGGGRFITCVEDENDVRNVGQRMTSGGFLRCKDALWGRERELAVNLADVVVVVLYSGAEATGPLDEVE